MVTPNSLYMFLTENCNLHCKHCYGGFSHRKRKNELSLENWIKVFDEGIKANIFYYVLSGGEPTCYEFFPDIVRYLKEKNQFFALVTNGIFTKDIEELLIDSKDNVIELKISLDGFNHETHSYLHNITEGEFKDLILRITTFIENGIKVVLGINVHHKTVGNIREFCNVINELNPTAINVSIITGVGRAKTMPEHDKEYRVSEIEKINNDFKKYINSDIKIGFVDMPFTEGEFNNFGFSCPAMGDFFAVDSHGTLLPCPLFIMPALHTEFNFPNLLKDGLPNSLKYTLFEELSQAKKSPCICGDVICKNIAFCDRCIAQSLLKKNIYEAPDFCLQYRDLIF